MAKYLEYTDSGVDSLKKPELRIAMKELIAYSKEREKLHQVYVSKLQPLLKISLGLMITVLTQLVVIVVLCTVQSGPMGSVVVRLLVLL